MRIDIYSRMYISAGFLVVNDNDQTKMQWRWMQGPNFMFLHHDAKYLPWLYKSKQVRIGLCCMVLFGSNDINVEPLSKCFHTAMSMHRCVQVYFGLPCIIIHETFCHAAE